MSSSNIYFEQVPVETIEEQIVNGQISDKMTNGDDPSVEHEPVSPDEEGLEYPQWQKPLQEAMLEINGVRLAERVSLAEMAIADRLRSIVQEPGSQLELQAIGDALSSLRILKQDVLGYAR